MTDQKYLLNLCQKELNPMNIKVVNMDKLIKTKAQLAKLA